MERLIAASRAPFPVESSAPPCARPRGVNGDDEGLRGLLGRDCFIYRGVRWTERGRLRVSCSVKNPGLCTVIIWAVASLLSRNGQGMMQLHKGIKKPFSKPQFRIPHETRAEGIAGNSALQVPTVQLDWCNPRDPAPLQDGSRLKQNRYKFVMNLLATSGATVDYSLRPSP